MAYHERVERYSNVIIDSSDMTLTEFVKDGVNTYSLVDILERWNGVPGVSITINRRTEIPPLEEVAESEP